MATRETRCDRGRRRGRSIAARLVGELVIARQASGLSQRALAGLLGWSQAEISRIERMETLDRLSVIDLSAIAAVLGLDLGANLYPAGEPIRDKGHQVLIGRFRTALSPAWRISAEMPLPQPGDR